MIRDRINPEINPESPIVPRIGQFIWTLISRIYCSRSGILLGRGSSGLGSAEEIEIGEGLEFDGASLKGVPFPPLALLAPPENASLLYTNTTTLGPPVGAPYPQAILTYYEEYAAWMDQSAYDTSGATGWVVYGEGTLVLQYSNDWDAIGSWIGAGTNPSDVEVWSPSGVTGIPNFVASNVGGTSGRLGQTANVTLSDAVHKYECVSVLPYTWDKINSSVTITTAPQAIREGSQYFDSAIAQTLTRYGTYWVGDGPSEIAENDIYTRALAAAMAASIDTRISGKTASVALPLFSGKTNSLVHPTTLAQNANCWAHDIRSQLCGFHVDAGGYYSSYGLIPLGGRFFLNVAHGGPEPVGITIRFPTSGGGTLWSTTLSSVFLDYGLARLYDFAIYVMADPAPSDLSIIPIANFDINGAIMNSLNPPTVLVSQGNVQTGTGNQLTPDFRKLSIASWTGASWTGAASARNDYKHWISTGDSGCPEYVLINNRLYLYKMNTASFSPVGPGLAYMQDLLNRAAAALGIPPITIQSVTNPSL